MKYKCIESLIYVKTKTCSHAINFALEKLFDSV